MSCLMLVATLALGADPQSTPPARAGVAIGQQGQSMASNLDGTWTVLCAEKDGQKLGQMPNATVTIHGNVLTWQKEGKEHRMRLQLGANNMLSATPEHDEPAAKAPAKTSEHPQGAQANQRAGNAAPAEPAKGIPTAVPAKTGLNGLPQTAGSPLLSVHQGVYIETNDFLCLSLNKGFDGEMSRQEAAASAKPAAPNTPNSNADKNALGARAAQPVAEPKGTASTVQANSQPAAKAGEIRTANYGVEQHPTAGNMNQKGFVLILRRETGQQPQVHGK